MRRWREDVARLLAAVFLYALLLPPDAAPCIHHRAAAQLPAGAQPTAGAHEAHAGGHLASVGAAHRDAGQAGHGGGLGCGCCIGGMCAGACGGGCRLPSACCGAGAPIDLLLEASALTAAPARVVADTRSDLSAPLARPQTPRAPPVI